MNTLADAFWNTIFGIFFSVIVLSGMYYLLSHNFLVRAPSTITLVLIVFATARLVRLISYDHIFEFARAWLSRFPRGTFLGTLSALVRCPWCTGLWFAFFVLFLYYITPIAYPIIIMLAVAMLASLVQVLSNFIGWSAEQRKQVVQTSGVQDTAGRHITTESSCG